MLHLENVSKRYPGEGPAAVDGISLQIPPVKTLALIGPSGCGKSTLLRLMLGLIDADEGEIRFGTDADGDADGAAVIDYRTAGADDKRRLRRLCGYVIQDGGLFPHLTARGNVALLPKILGWDRGRIESRLTELAELTNFPQDGLDRYPVELSGGQRQRVALMRGLVTDPEMLLLDEPLGALDPMIRFDLQRDLREIFRALGKTTVIVTHDLAEAAYFADEIVLMRAGRIVQKGTMADLSDRPAEPFVSEFVSAQRTLHVAEEGGRP